LIYALLGESATSSSSGTPRYLDSAAKASASRFISSALTAYEPGGEKGYNLRMQLAVFAMRVLEVMFFVGLAGSTVVVLISFVEDGIELFGKDEPPQSRA
jgi:hypothetical protein